jgi:pantetheine-phosphate adenylyltransferase
MKVCIGGTFDILHKGHKILISKALEVAEKQGHIFIGITSEEFFRNKKNLKTFEERKKNVLDYISKKKTVNQVVVKPINDKYGPSVDGDFDAIVVSPETIKTAEEINKKRREIGKKPLKIIEIPFILAEDNKPISSSRIKKGEIDTNGNLPR